MGNRIRILLLCAASLGAQTYDIVLKGGHIIDPANNIDAIGDVAISAGKIAKVGGTISDPAKKTIDVKGRYVTPGLVDLHFHSFGYSGSIFPDDTALLTGTTTVVDAGGPGYRTINEFRKQIVATSATRVLALINIAGNGMTGRASEDNVADMLSDKTADAIKANRDIVVGIKVAHFGKPGWDAIDRAEAAGKSADVPVMIDDKIFTNAGRTSREKLLDKMRPGDMHTHMYNDRQVEIISRFNGRVEEYALAARKRGVLFDLGHGGGSFLWPVAATATRQGFWPDTISTDLHTSSILGTQSDMPNCISKMMVLGMPLNEAIAKSTAAPAKAIHRFPEIGTLGVGQIADVAVLALEEGVFSYKDAWGKKMLGKKRLEAVATIRAGKLVFDAEGRGFPEWTKAGEYEVIQ
jgi:dihydroorotase